jgi:cob(I)alamin adenosyltransferase
MRMERGLIMVYTGDEEYHSVSAVGQVFRAIGRKLKVKFFDFSGEFLSERGKKLLDKFDGLLEVRQAEEHSADKSSLGAKDLWSEAKAAIPSSNPYVIVLYEIGPSVSQGFIDPTDVIQALENKPESVDVILTGSHFPPAIMEMADLITEVVDLKHNPDVDLNP